MVVPEKIRKALGLKKGDNVFWKLKKAEGKTIAEVRPHPKSWAEYTLGLGKETWKGVDVDKYIDELRNEWDRKF